MSKTKRKDRQQPLEKKTYGAINDSFHINVKEILMIWVGEKFEWSENINEHNLFNIILTYFPNTKFLE
jgi:CRISPR/Cas system CMR subunit Cmr6 (Cas7 group RAMP superfamily)